jgi:hypothetical protein
MSWQMDGRLAKSLNKKADSYLPPSQSTGPEKFVP